MFVHQLSIDITTEEDREEISSTMESVTSCMRTAGITQGREPVEYLLADQAVAVVYTMEEDSLDVRFRNGYVQYWITKLENLCGSTLQNKLLGKSTPDYEGTCACTSRPHFVLFTTYVTLGSPLLCGACNRCVPLYKIPMDEGSHDKILRWQSNYQACDTLQMNCEVGERWGLRQMQDPKSQLSQLGRKLCLRIEELTATPTYYFLFNYRNIRPALDRRRTCPSCGGPWLLESSLHDEYEFMCSPCRLISTKTRNSASDAL